MANPEILEAMKVLSEQFQEQLQTKLEEQAAVYHTSLQKSIAALNGRIEGVRFQLSGYSASTSEERPSSCQHPSDSLPLSANVQLLPRSMRLEIPKFDGTDPKSWVFKIEEFFNFHETPASLWLRIISFHMEGKASAWYQWMKGSNLLTTWPDFLSNVRQRFGSSVYEDHQGNLSKLSQTSTVAEFQTEFEELMNLITGIPEHLLISFFIAGLRPHLRREMLLQRPTTLMATFSLARAYEARYEEAP